MDRGLEFFDGELDLPVRGALPQPIQVKILLRDAMEIRRQLGRADGLVGYCLNAELTRKVFWTFSAWEGQAALDAFAGSDPHRRITRRLAPVMGETRFETLTVAGSRLPLPWPEIQHQTLGR